MGEAGPSIRRWWAWSTNEAVRPTRSPEEAGRAAEASGLCLTRGSVPARLAVVLTTGVVLVGCASSTGSPSGVSTPRASSRTTGASSKIAALRVLQDGRSDAFVLRTGLGQVWGVTGSGSLVRLKPDGTAGLTVPLGATAVDLAFAGPALYVLTTGAVLRVDPVAGRVVKRYPLTGKGVALAATTKSLYVQVGGARSELQSIDVITGARKSLIFPAPFSLEMRASSVAVGSDGVVWAIDAATLVEVSAASLTVLHRYALPLFGTTIALTPYGVTVAARGIGDGVARLAPGESSARICWLGDAQQLVLDGQMMWASAAAGLTELDARTCRPVATTPAIDTGNSTDGIAVLPDQVWLAYESGDFQRIAKS